MPGSLKKTAKEKRATRKAQNERYRASKENAGLRQVTVWVPVEALEQVSGFRKVGLVVSDEEISPLVVKVRKCASGFVWEGVGCQGNLLL